MIDLAPLERYRPLIDDWPAFAAALARPLPVVAWTNELRIEPGELARRLAAAGLAPRPLPWLAGAFRLPADARPGATLEFAAGLCHLQEEASLLAPALLAARPGERIVDLCAAPGGKTARIALDMRDRGTVVANDRDAGRLGPLRRTTARLGLTSVVATAWDAVNFPPGAGPFDRVLVDAPCSCEGTSRKNPEVLARLGPSADEHRRRLARLQRLMLAKAVRLVRPGGRIVYATCTYAPEENELVIDDVLREAGPGALVVLPVRVPGFATSPGLTAWRGRPLAAGLAGAARVWPHRNDTGGCFVAVLERGGVGEAASGGGGPGRPAAGEPDRRGLAAVEARFGIPRASFEPYRLAPGGRKRLALVPRELAPPARPPALALGLPLLRVGAVEPKLTTAAAMAFGARATRNVVDVDRARAEAYLCGGEIVVDAAETGAVTGEGYVVVRHDGIGLGVGRYRRAGAGGAVASLYPRGWRPGAGSASVDPSAGIS
jgi:16S rRNA C967 or C1407 C5-methylase (RsmB/RsmF family)/NOL1/NOP2/fmu family ribosome biogenesis protein